MSLSIAVANGSLCLSVDLGKEANSRQKFATVEGRIAGRKVVLMLFWIVSFSLLGSLGAVGGAGLLLLLPTLTRQRWAPLLLSYATGSLLGAAILGMLPKALEYKLFHRLAPVLLLGILFFFILEKFLLWHHSHEQKSSQRTVQLAPLLMFGDTLHNFTDGLFIATAFMSSIPLGISASLAVISHEIPQELGDFSILLEAGWSRSKAFWINAISSLSILPGALFGYLILGKALSLIPYLLTLSAASFVYIAMADLVPLLHRQTSIKESLAQIAFLIAGMASIALLPHVH